MNYSNTYKCQLWCSKTGASRPQTTNDFYIPNHSPIRNKLGRHLKISNLVYTDSAGTTAALHQPTLHTDFAIRSTEFLGQGSFQAGAGNVKHDFYSKTTMWESTRESSLVEMEALRITHLIPWQYCQLQMESYPPYFHKPLPRETLDWSADRPHLGSVHQCC